jgi:hypothetical protein
VTYENKLEEYERLFTVMDENIYHMLNYPKQFRSKRLSVFEKYSKSATDNQLPQDEPPGHPQGPIAPNNNNPGPPARNSL